MCGVKKSFFVKLKSRLNVSCDIGDVFLNTKIYIRTRFSFFANENTSSSERILINNRVKEGTEARVK